MDNFLEENFIKGKSIQNEVGKKVTYEDILKYEIKNLNEQEKREEDSLIGQIEGIVSIASSRDGKILASGSKDSTIRLWNLEKKQVEYSFNGHGKEIVTIAFSPDGTYLASASNDNIIKLWNINTKTEVDSLSCDYCIKSMIFSLDGKYLIIGSADKTIKVFNIRENNEEFLLEGHTGEVLSIAVSPNQKYVATGSEDHTIKIWNFIERRKDYTLSGHIKEVLAVLFSSNGKLLISGSGDKTIKIWSILEEEECYTLIGHTGRVLNIIFLFDENYIASCSDDKTIKIWNLTEKREEYSLISHTDIVRSIVFIKDRNYIISGSDDKTIKIWNLSEKKEAYSLSWHTNGVTSASFSKDGIYLATGSIDKTIKIWNMNEKKEECSLIGHMEKVTCLAFFSNRNYLASVSTDNSVKIWNLEKRKDEFSIDGVKVLALSDKFLARGFLKHIIKIWDIEKKREQGVFNGHTDTITSLVFTSDGKYLASGSEDKNIIIWNIEDEKKWCCFNNSHIDGVLALAFSPDGNYLVSGSADKTIKIWNLTQKQEFYFLNSHTGPVTSLAFSSDGGFFASGSGDKSVKIWNFIEKREEYSLKAHSKQVTSVAFSPYGDFLASASEDNSVKIWYLKEERTLYKFIDNEDPDHSKNRKINFSPHYEKKYLTEDLKYELLFQNNFLKLCKQIDSKPEVSRHYFISPNSILDPYYQNKSLFYNFIDSLKSEQFENISASTSNLFFSTFSYSALHFICYFGRSDILKKLLNDDCVIKADLFGKSPFYYSIKKNSQECLDALLEFFASLLSSKSPLQSQRVLNSVYAIRNDFRIIIESSSKLLVPFLKKLLVNSSIIFAKLNKKFPSFRFSRILNPRLEEFGNNEEKAEEISLVLKTSLVPLENSVDSKNTFELLRAIADCENKDILKTPIIQYFTEFYWKRLRKWRVGYCTVIFLNMGIFLIAVLLENQNNYPLIIFFVINLMLFAWEVIQIRSKKWDYIKDPHNLLDLPRITLAIIWIFIKFVDQIQSREYFMYRILTLVISFLNIIRSFTGFSLFDNYVRLITMALSDIVHFMMIFSYSTVSIGLLLFIADDNLDYNLLWVDSFSLSFGNSNLGERFKPNDSLKYIVFLIATIINVVLMLNLLISILGDSYDRFQINQVQYEYEDQLEFILEVLEIRLVFSQAIRWTEGQYLHVCTHSQNSGETGNWGGKLRYTDEKLNENNLILLDEIENIKQKLETSQNQMNKNLESLETVIKEKTANFHSNLKETFENTIKEKFGNLGNTLKEKVGSMEFNVKESVKLFVRQNSMSSEDFLKLKVEGIEDTIKETLGDFEKIIVEKIETIENNMKQKVEGIENNIENKVDNIQSIIGLLEGRVSSIEQKLELILNLVSKQDKLL